MSRIPFNINTHLFCSDLDGRQILNYEDDIDGYISSPGYPAHYPDNINYTWILRSRHMRRIDIKIIHMNIIYQVPCGDYLEVCVVNKFYQIRIKLFLFPFSSSFFRFIYGCKNKG